MTAVDFSRPGAWKHLWSHALVLTDHLESQITDAFWTFGGGTVLMLRIAHRQSKDIDLFVPDPQYLGYINPRLSDVAESVSSDYEEAAEYIKLFLPKGEIDVVVGSSLTSQSYEWVKYRGRDIRVETPAEIIAKNDVAPWRSSQGQGSLRLLCSCDGGAGGSAESHAIHEEAWGGIPRGPGRPSGTVGKRFR